MSGEQTPDARIEAARIQLAGCGYPVPTRFIEFALAAADRAAPPATGFYALEPCPFPDCPAVRPHHHEAHGVFGPAAAAPPATEYETLARHHLECERLAEEMAALLGHIAEGHKPPDMGLRIAHLRARWDAHQWPDLNEAAAGAAPPATASPCCSMCGGEGYVLAPSTTETADTAIPCPNCRAAPPAPPTEEAIEAALEWLAAAAPPEPPEPWRAAMGQGYPWDDAAPPAPPDALAAETGQNIAPKDEMHTLPEDRPVADVIIECLARGQFGSSTPIVVMAMAREIQRARAVAPPAIPPRPSLTFEFDTQEQMDDWVRSHGVDAAPLAEALRALVKGYDQRYSVTSGHLGREGEEPPGSTRRFINTNPDDYERARKLLGDYDARTEAKG